VYLPVTYPFCPRSISSLYREAESSRKLAEELRHKSEQAEMECATAASMQQTYTNHSNGFDHYGGGANNADVYGGMGLMGGQNQGGYSNPFAMG
jgi:hypothetical protein